MICYARRKTGQLLSIRIEPSIQRIIDRYADTESPYVFPILSSLDAKKHTNNIKSHWIPTIAYSADYQRCWGVDAN